MNIIMGNCGRDRRVTLRVGSRERAGSAAGKICPLHGLAGSIPSFCSTDSGCCGHRKSIPEVSTDTDMGLVIVTLESRHLEHCGDTVLLTLQLGHQATLESAFPEEEMKDFWRLMFQVGPAFHCRLPSKPRRLTAHSAGLLGTNTLD